VDGTLRWPGFTRWPNTADYSVVLPGSAWAPQRGETLTSNTATSQNRPHKHRCLAPGSVGTASRARRGADVCWAGGWRVGETHGQWQMLCNRDYIPPFVVKCQRRFFTCNADDSLQKLKQTFYLAKARLLNECRHATIFLCKHRPALIYLHYAEGETRAKVPNTCAIWSKEWRQVLSCVLWSVWSQAAVI